MNNDNSNQLTDLATQALNEGDFARAMELYKQASAMGNFYATYDVACMYYFGHGVPKSDEQAFAWYKKASEQGDPEATNRVAVMLGNGIGVEKDEQKAFAYYLRSAEMGSLSGMANAGLCYLQGLGIDADLAVGLDWLDKAARGGNGIASLTMAEYWDQGKYSLAPDPVKAVEYLRLGMSQKYAPAISRLAEMYQEGRGVSKDPAKAAELRRIAAETPDED